MTNQLKYVTTNQWRVQAWTKPELDDPNRLNWRGRTPTWVDIGWYHNEDAARDGFAEWVDIYHNLRLVEVVDTHEISLIMGQGNARKANAS